MTRLTHLRWQIKTEPSASVEEVIKRDLEGNPVFVYMKVSPPTQQERLK